MARGETDLEMAERHVVEAEARIERQKQIIAEMERDFLIFVSIVNRLPDRWIGVPPDGPAGESA